MYLAHVLTIAVSEKQQFVLPIVQKLVGIRLRYAVQSALVCPVQGGEDWDCWSLRCHRDKNLAIRVILLYCWHARAAG